MIWSQERLPSFFHSFSRCLLRQKADFDTSIGLKEHEDERRKREQIQVKINYTAKRFWKKREEGRYHVQDVVRGQNQREQRKRRERKSSKKRSVPSSTDLLQREGKDETGVRIERGSLQENTVILLHLFSQTALLFILSQSSSLSHPLSVILSGLEVQRERQSPNYFPDYSSIHRIWCWQDVLSRIERKRRIPLYLTARHRKGILFHSLHCLCLMQTSNIKFYLKGIQDPEREREQTVWQKRIAWTPLGSRQVFCKK